MINRLFFHIITGFLGIVVSVNYIPNLNFNGSWIELAIAGILIGFINSFIKPVIKIIFLPLRILTFGIFGFLINLGLIWLVIGFILRENFDFSGILPLILTSFLIWLLNFIFNLIIIFKK